LPILRLELVTKSVLVNTQAQPKGSVLPLCVILVLLAVLSCIVKGEMYILYHEASQSIWTYFVSKMFHDCIIFNTVV